MSIFKGRLLGDYKMAVLSGYFYTIITLVSSIFVTRHIFLFLDNNQYGVFILIVETIAVFGILDFGFSGGMVAFLSREADDKVRVNKLVSTLFFCQVALAVIAFLLSLSLFYEPSLIFDDVNVEDNVLKNSLLIGSFSLLLTLISKSVSQILYARRKIAGDNYLKIGSLVIRVFLIFVFLERFPTIEFLILITFITQGINLAITVYLVKKVESTILFNIRDFDFAILSEVWKVSSWFALGGFSIILIERFDNIMSGLIISASAITTLVITRKLFDIAKTFVFQLNNNYRPYFGKLIGQGKHLEVLSKFNMLSFISVVFASFLGGGIVIINEYFINLWVGDNKFGGIILSVLLFLNLVFHAWKISYRVFLSSNLIAKELAISSFIEGILNVGLAYILGIKYGLEGIVASTFLSGVVVQVIAFFFINRKFKLETFSIFAFRNFGQILLVTLLGVSAYLITVSFNLIVIKLFIWFVLIGFSLFSIHRVFFKEYPFFFILKGKLL